MTNEIDYQGLRAHIFETIKSAIHDGSEAYKGLGSAWGTWAVTAVKVKIAERAKEQTFVSPETYARVAGTVLREALEAA